MSYDFVVAGAGPAASTFAALSAARGATVLIVGNPPRHAAETLELMSGRTLNALTALGLVDEVERRWPRLEATDFRWGRDDFATKVPDPTPWGPGWIVNRTELDALMLERAESAGAQVVAGIVSGISTVDGSWQMRYLDTKSSEQAVTVTAKGVALATGRTSKLGARAGISRRVRHRMVSITAWLPVGALSGRFGQPGRMLVDTSANGWWYALGDGGGTTVGFVTDADLMQPGPDRALATWQFEAAQNYWLPSNASSILKLRASTVSEAVVPNTFGSKSVAEGVLPLGDAALAADPMSGHGLILALDGAMRAATDPATYWQWLGRAQAAHAQHEGALYAAEPRYQGAPFWSRRRPKER